MLLKVSRHALYQAVSSAFDTANALEWTTVRVINMANT